MQDVLTGAQSLLGDASGEISQEIFDDFCSAYAEMLDLADKWALPTIQRETFYTLPANTAALFPASLGVTDFDQPVSIEERGNVVSVAVASTTDGTPQIVTTATPHGLASNQRIELGGIMGVPNWINRDWFITVIDALNFSLNGSITNGGSNGTGGSVMYSQEVFTPMNLVLDIDPYFQVAQVLGVYFWQDNIIWFTGSTVPRQLKITYLASDVPPNSGPIGFANGRELLFLKTATAAHFAPKRQLPMGPQLTQWAYGPGGEPDGGGGFLRSLMVPLLQQQQNRQQIPQRYRRRRGFAPYVL